jgi:CheY-like chemotaxis protein
MRSTSSPTRLFQIVHGIVSRIDSPIMKKFLIEDEPAVQSYIVAILKKAGHLVETEQNGTTAFQRYCKEGPFDLVLTDLEHKG